MMTYTFARVGAVLGMHVEDYYPQGKRWWIRLQVWPRHESKQDRLCEKCEIYNYVIAFLSIVVMVYPWISNSTTKTSVGSVKI